jgi:hypothetical protein
MMRWAEQVTQIGKIRTVYKGFVEKHEENI